jgi:hypothetical protein
MLQKIAILLLLLLSCEIPLLAESVKVYNLTFAVEVLNKYQDGLIEVQVFGNSGVVAIESVPRYVTNLYFADGGLDFIRMNVAKFSVNELDHFLENALNAKDDIVATYGLIALSVHPLSSDNLNYWHKIENIAQARFKKIIDNAFNSIGRFKDPPLTTLPIFFLNYIYNDNSYSSAIIENNQNQIRELCVHRFINLALRGFNLDAKLTLKRCFDYKIILAEEKDKFTLMIENALKIAKALKYNRRKEISKVISYFHSSGAIGKEVLKQIAGFINYKSEQLIKQKRSELAIWLLAQLSFEMYNEKNKLTLIKALTALENAENSIVVTTTGLAGLLQELSDYDVRVRRSYISYLHSQILYLLSRGNTSQVPVFIKILQSIEKPPLTVTDSVKFIWSQYLFQVGRDTEGVKILESLSGALPLKQRFYLFLVRFYYGLPILFSILITSVVTFICSSIYAIFAIKRQRKRKAEEEIARHKRLFVHSKSVQTGINPVLQEYAKCIKILGVEAGASIQDIKAAYRKASKQYHPDSGNSASVEKFLELGEAQDKLLEIEKNRLITKEDLSMLNMLHI